MSSKNVAIACQGGGTHAAFTWGVLLEILNTKTAWDRRADEGDTFDIVAVSGTSAGALCALATWYGLAPNTADPSCGGIDKAIERLDFLWTTFAATTPAEAAFNQLVGSLLDLKSRGVPFPETDPYAPYGAMGLTTLAKLGARPQFLGFQALLDDLCPHFAAIDWAKLATLNRRILAGAIEIVSGNFEIFDSDKSLEERGLLEGAPKINQYESTRWRMRRALSLEGVAASGTLPDVLPAQVIPDLAFPLCHSADTVVRNGFYWDGLYSQNPPVRDLLDGRDAANKADEIWVIRINPQEMRESPLRMNPEAIRDRENDLAGNLSLNQELDHILTINRWLETYGNEHPPLKDRKTVTVRTIKMLPDTVWGMSHTTKFDRSPEHLHRLRDEGRQVARQWLGDWRAQGDAFARYPDDARYTVSARSG